MVRHEHFWDEFLGAPFSFEPYTPFPQHVRHAVIAKLGQVCFSHVKCHIMTVTWLTQTMGSCFTCEEFKIMAKLGFYM